MRSFPSLLALTFLFLTLARAAAAGEVTIPASRDNTMYAESGNESNGAGERFFSGTNGMSENRRALIRFDVAAAVPAGSTVTAVEMTLYMSRTNGGPYDISLHELTADWGEGTSNAPNGDGSGAPATTGDATWTKRFHPGTFWASNGGDFVPVASATTSVDQIAYYAWSGAGLVADVQGWLATPAQNFGWILINANELDTPTAKRFDSRTNSDITTRPRLRIVYDPPCTGSAASYCVAAPNSTGVGALIGSTGSLSIAANNFALTCAQLPPNTSHIYFFGPTQIQVPFGNGFRCVGGTATRLNPLLMATPSGTSTRAIDFTVPPVLGNITPGSTHYFQCWYRNPAGGGAAFNLSDGLSVTFCN